MIEQNKKSKLKERIDYYTQNDVAVAFSGGVDSSLLLKLAVESAKENHTKVYALIAHTTFHPIGDLEMAKQVASEVGAIQEILYLKELEEAGITENPTDRCYRCKYYIFQSMLKITEGKQIPFLLEGTNMDDTKMYRPGIQAIRELGVKSPLLEAGFTKQEIREMAAEYGISTADRPATPCMATRFPYGTHLTSDKLRKVELSEQFMRESGFSNIRVRVHDELARLEIDSEQFTLLMDKKEQIISYLKSLGYQYVSLDLEGFRSGSMDEGLRRIEEGEKR